MNARIQRPRNGPVVVGVGQPTGVMALTGISYPNGHDAQVRKIDALLAMENGPDVIADLSIVNLDKPLWQYALEAGSATATLPVYTASRCGARISADQLLDIAMHQMASGVGMLTIHPTPTRELIESAADRLVPWTSRGGGLIIRDLMASDENENAYARILPELVEAAAKYNTVLSLGASFRAANIFDSLDAVQRAEIDAQISLAKEIAAAGVGVIIESPGHARPIDIWKCAEILAPSQFPIMPLGPIPTDAAIGFDHVSAAIGATLMGLAGAAHILAAVTREEHTGGVPSIESTIEAINAARVAAHIIDIHTIGATDPDHAIVAHRAKHHTCVVGKFNRACSRCAQTCPL